MRFAIAAFVLLAGCDSLAPVDPDAGVPVTSGAALTAAWEAWDAAEPETYRLRYEMACECFGGATVRVREGRVVSAEGPGASEPKTVGDLFAHAREVLDAGEGSVRLSSTAPRFPVFLDVNPDGQTVDGGFRLTVTGYEAD